MDSWEIYTLIENSKSLELQMIKDLKMSLIDFIYLPNENYLILYMEIILLLLKK